MALNMAPKGESNRDALLSTDDTEENACRLRRPHFGLRHVDYRRANFAIALRRCLGSTRSTCSAASPEIVAGGSVCGDTP